MSKRELGTLAGDVDLDGPRTKRRKDIPPETADSAMQDPTATAEKTETVERTNSMESSVKEQGLRMWQMVKDAVNKEGLICSPPFMRLPSKRHYADYYTIIAQPICLEDIKKRLDDGNYDSLEAVRHDFEICFSNAKQYNVKNSAIWQDAKFLLKMVNKEYTKITGKKKGSGADENGDEADGEDGKKKNKPPNMNRLLKARLQKLVEKTDEDTGRVLSDVFMEMPSKKDYPIYYKQIKKPMCIENIFKHLKRKEYPSSTEFATDVELVFSNALAFNQDHSQIWEDAVTLRDYFRQLMSDLPPPHALPQYTKPSPGKIKLKVPVPGGTAGPSGSTSVPTTAQLPSQDVATVPSSLTLRLPGATSATKSPKQSTTVLPQAVPSAAATPSTIQTPAPTPAAVPKPVAAPQLPLPTTPLPTAPSPAPTGSTTTSAPAPAPAPVPAPTPAPASVPVAAQIPAHVTQPRATRSPQVTTQPLPYSTTPSFSHYPNATYQAHLNASQPAISAPAPPVYPPAQHTAPSASRSPAPSYSDRRQLKGIFLTTKPRGRPILLDHRDGVKTWAMRLGYGENGVSVAEVKFHGDDEEDGSDQEDEAQGHLQEEEEEEEEPVPKKRGRGRPPKNPAAKAKAAAAAAAAKKAERLPKVRVHKAHTPLRENIHVIVNGTAVSEKVGEQGVWDVDLQVGSNVLEIGEKGGMFWKVYMERVSV
ncbi:Bromodomain-containing protein [Leucogyrophana mollusca]|uniref:Bromodomain-containing protein n=1 Tax=Leucogyrophana mollusca TaxID=85980 RepID=A0ACB8BK05_9AGAM|nr:Bromodomain-containing protein [Leucogyrophana mollusca]